jgi:hypothetical protein
MTPVRSNGSAKREVARSAMCDAELQTTGDATDPDLPLGPIACAATGRE